MDVTKDGMVRVGLVVLGLLYGLVQGEEGSIFRSLFSREANHRLSGIVAKQLTNSSVEHCSELCVKETDFQCKSFDFDNKHKACLLFSVSVDDPDVNLIATDGRDHYKTLYSKLFHRLPNHMLTTSHNRRIDDVSVEECARRCILEAFFKCRGFDFELTGKTCWLTELTPERVAGVSVMSGWDYYERTPEGPLDRFVNYGYGHMRQLRGDPVYLKNVMGVSLDSCATMCLAEQSFHCISFDYFFSSQDISKTVCYLSKYTAAHVYGLDASYDRRTMHFERKEKYLTYFYATPYAVVLGNNHKTYTRVTPNRCARMCLEEEGFVCRSFDYKIEDGTCLLSSKTGSDVGGLYNQGLREVHHFEMKPILDCGGNLTHNEGSFASPNWPRNYAHHEYCVWTITVQLHKVIELKFTHLDLGLQYHNPCSEREDRLVISERTQYNDDSFCVLPNTKNYVTRSHQAKVRFISNADTDGQGFRVFYEAVWPCDVLLTAAPGEFASPAWPDNYPPNTRCSWRLTAPPHMRVRVYFTKFELEKHTLGHCNDGYDHVVVLDGGAVSAPRIGLYCGNSQPFTVRSSGRDMFVQFKSDAVMVRPGFHARFDFETQNGTTMDTSSKLGEEFIPLDTDSKGAFVGEPGVGKRLQEEDVSDEGSDHHYKTTMWAVITTLLLLLVIAGVVIYILWQRHRGWLGRQREEVHEDFSPEEVPLQQNQAVCSAKPNNECLHGNEIDLTAGGATAKDTAYTNLLYGEVASNKYNMTKNINLDTK